jgi:hypothetical protein
MDALPPHDAPTDAPPATALATDADALKRELDMEKSKMTGSPRVPSPQQPKAPTPPKDTKVKPADAAISTSTQLIEVEAQKIVTETMIQVAGECVVRLHV